MGKFEGWTVTSRLRVSEERVLRRTRGHNREAEKGDWPKLHSEQSTTLYSSQDIGRSNQSGRDGRNCKTHGGYKKCIKTFGRKI